jgi:23S rRNA pseudouridine2457 synthase
MMSETGHRYFIIHKPYQMLSQFISGPTDTGRMLGALNFDFPEGTHAIGRLDYESEGLLILTTNKRVTRLLFQGEVPHKRTYLVKVAHEVSEATVEQLRTGISIRVQGGDYYTTAPCEVAIVERPAHLPELAHEHNPYIRSTWLQITLTEGKFHQIRKMVHTVKHRCQRLIRVSIEDIALDDLPSGGVREVEEAAFFEQLQIHNWL